MKDFVNLHAHTNLGSMLDALVSVDDLFDKVKELGQKALAITDHGTLAAHYDAFRAYKRTGIKFIPGCETYFVHSYDIINQESKGRKKTERRKHIVLLAQNYTGYKNLLKINFAGFQHQVTFMGRVFPRISWDILEKYSEGLICTSACANGVIAAALRFENYDKAVEIAHRFAYTFPDRFYLELHPHLLKNDDLDQHALNEQLISIAQKNGIPLTCAIDTHYLTRESEKYHDVLMALNSKAPVDDPNRHRYGIDEFYAKTGEEVYTFLEKYYGSDIAEEAVGNTVKIAEMCQSPDYMESKGNHLPVFDPSNEVDYQEFLEWKQKARIVNISEDAAFMRFRVFKGFKQKFKTLSKEQIAERLERVKQEIKVFEKNSFSSYMLVVADFIKWAKENDILVGIGRGSVGGSMVAYLLGIHGVDPIKYGLLFERFQNAEKKDLPDIDVDFTSSGRDLVKQYCMKKYGVDHCAQVSNINTYTPKNVIPDLVKSMRNVMPNLVPEGTNYVQISEAIKAAIPDQDEEGDRVKTLESAIAISPKLKEFAERCPELMEYADAIIGLPKEYSTHAAGMVISDIPIVEFAPLRIDKDGTVAMQYEKNRCEANGLVKIDFLAISTLDVIDETLKNVRRLGIQDAPRQMEDIPLDDKDTYKMIQDGHTRCVFQLGKSGMMATLCKQIKPAEIADIAMVNALGRPSCAEERQPYVERRFGYKKIEYLHSSLIRTLEQTYGLCIMEEQLMGVAKDVAGWDLNKADGLRKLTKLKEKGKDLALKLEVEFIQGMMEMHQVEYEFAKRVWDEIVGKFSGYGFNKSHAIFYSINGYITAYLKRHYPAAFLAAYLKVKTARGGIGKDDEIAAAKAECRRIGIKILPPDINRSGIGYEVLDEKTIVMGLAAIKGLGDKAVEEIVRNQPYENFAQFLEKTEGRVINKSKMEALAKAGCFDSLNVTRKDIHDLGKKNRDRFNVWVKKNVSKNDGYEAAADFEVKLEGMEWSRQERLRHEQEVLGELVSGSIDDLYPGFFTGVGATPIGRLKILPDRHEIIVEFLVEAKLREFKIKSGRYTGQPMIKYRVSDAASIETELTVWPSEYKIAKKLLQPGRPVRAICQVSEFNGVKTLMLRHIEKVYGM